MLTPKYHFTLDAAPELNYMSRLPNEILDIVISPLGVADHLSLAQVDRRCRDAVSGHLMLRSPHLALQKGAIRQPVLEQLFDPRLTDTQGFALLAHHWEALETGSLNLKNIFELAMAGFVLADGMHPLEWTHAAGVPLSVRAWLIDFWMEQKPSLFRGIEYTQPAFAFVPGPYKAHNVHITYPLANLGWLYEDSLLALVATKGTALQITAWFLGISEGSWKNFTTAILLGSDLNTTSDILLSIKQESMDEWFHGQPLGQMLSLAAQNSRGGLGAFARKLFDRYPQADEKDIGDTLRMASQNPLLTTYDFAELFRCPWPSRSVIRYYDFDYALKTTQRPNILSCLRNSSFAAQAVSEVADCNRKDLKIASHLIKDLKLDRDDILKNQRQSIVASGTMAVLRILSYNNFTSGKQRLADFYAEMGGIAQLFDYSDILGPALRNVFEKSPLKFEEFKLNCSDALSLTDSRKKGHKTLRLVATYETIKIMEWFRIQAGHVDELILRDQAHEFVSTSKTEEKSFQRMIFCHLAGWPRLTQKFSRPTHVAAKTRFDSYTSITGGKHTDAYLRHQKFLADARLD